MWMQICSSGTEKLVKKTREKHAHFLFAEIKVKVKGSAQFRDEMED